MPREAIERGGAEIVAPSYAVAAEIREGRKEIVLEKGKQIRKDKHKLDVLRKEPGKRGMKGGRLYAVERISPKAAYLNRSLTSSPAWNRRPPR